MTQSYFEYLGRQESAPFTNEKLDYEKTEPDLTKAVNDQIDKNIKDREQFFHRTGSVAHASAHGKVVDR